MPSTANLAGEWRSDPFYAPEERSGFFQRFFAAMDHREMELYFEEMRLFISQLVPRKKPGAASGEEDEPMDHHVWETPYRLHRAPRGKMEIEYHDRAGRVRRETIAFDRKHLVLGDGAKAVGFTWAAASRLRAEGKVPEDRRRRLKR